MAILVVVLVAGCSGGGGSPATAPGPAPTTDPATGPTTDGSTATPTEAATPVPSETATPTAVTPDEDDLPSNAGARAVVRHTRTLVTASNYTVDYRVSGDTSFGQATLDGLVLVGQEIDGTTLFQRLSGNASGTSISIERYKPLNEAVVYSQLAIGDSPQYRRQSPAESGVSTFQQPFRRGDTVFTAIPNFTDEGIVDTATGPRRLFTVTELSQLGSGATEGPSRLVEIDISMLYDEDRQLVTRLVYNATLMTDGERTRAALTIDYGNLGTTPIQRPPWFTEAVRRTSGDSG
ncbi:hypothetical protein BRD17_06505 [Halobacteriales archaeon SW_7_68_16]|nr:MAG: hypothetical protein BRD17_06505 [Halobacteriales archaeon SW_7_68_16]